MRTVLVKGQAQRACACGELGLLDSAPRPGVRGCDLAWTVGDIIDAAVEDMPRMSEEECRDLLK